MKNVAEDQATTYIPIQLQDAVLLLTLNSCDIPFLKCAAVDTSHWGSDFPMAPDHTCCVPRVTAEPRGKDSSTQPSPSS